MRQGLKTYRCRVRASGQTLTVHCLAPTPLAAAYAVAKRVRRVDQAPWHQVVASEWNALLGQYIVPANAIVFAADDLPPLGHDCVVFAPSGPPAYALEEA
jgi:hypothetical protein